MEIRSRFSSEKASGLWFVVTSHVATRPNHVPSIRTFGVPHFHICVGEHKGPHNKPWSPELARHRRTARAEMYRRLTRAGTPVSWGARLFNGKDEQQITVLLPNPFLDRETGKILRKPDWSRLDLRDRLRARWLGETEPDLFDRSDTGFRHE